MPQASLCHFSALINPHYSYVCIYIIIYWCGCVRIPWAKKGERNREGGRRRLENFGGVLTPNPLLWLRHFYDVLLVSNKWKVWYCQNICFLCVHWIHFWLFRPSQLVKMNACHMFVFRFSPIAVQSRQHRNCCERSMAMTVLRFRPFITFCSRCIKASDKSSFYAGARGSVLELHLFVTIAHFWR